MHQPVMVPAAELAEDLGSDEILIAYYSEEAPVAGGHAYHDDFRPGNSWPYDGIKVRYARVPRTGWGDYVGSTYDRSNYQLLAGRYPDHLITVGSERTGRCLVVPLDSEIPEDLYRSIVYLGEECVLDEMHLSEVENELENECWESLGRHDFRQEICALADDDSMDSDDLDMVDELDDDEYTDELFQEVRDTSGSGLLEFRIDGATSGYWFDLKAGAALAWGEIRRRRAARSEAVA